MERELKERLDKIFTENSFADTSPFDSFNSIFYRMIGCMANQYERVKKLGDDLEQRTS